MMHGVAILNFEGGFGEVHLTSGGTPQAPPTLSDSHDGIL